MGGGVPYVYIYIYITYSIYSLCVCVPSGFFPGQNMIINEPRGSKMEACGLGIRARV